MMAVAFQSSSIPIPPEDYLAWLAFFGGLLFFMFLGLFAIYWGFNRWKLGRLIQDTPTEKVRSMATGRTELEGTVRECEGSITVPYEDNSCVYVDWTAERREEGDNGKWVTVAEGMDVYPFYLEDDTGRALVRADCDDPTVDFHDDAHRVRVTYDKGEHAPPEVREFVGGDQPEPDESEGGFFDSAVETVTDMVEGEPPLEDVDHRRRYSHQVLPCGSDVYVFGGAKSRNESSMTEGQQDLLEIRRHDGTDTFLISDTDEEWIQQSHRQMAALEIAFGLVLTVGSLCILLLAGRSLYLLLVNGGSLYFLLSMLMP